MEGDIGVRFSWVLRGLSSAVEHLPYKEGVTGSNPVARTIGMQLTFTLLPDLYAIARLDGSAPTPGWPAGDFVSITRTPGELSIVCRADAVPRTVRADREWRCLALQGPFALDQTGVAAEFTRILSAAGVSVFVVATFDTDYVLVPDRLIERAVAALRGAGHAVRT